MSENPLSENRPTILEGIRVVELGQYIFVPEGASHLGDLGAEVIKVENINGEAGRGLIVNYGIDMRIGEGKLAWYERMNRNKKSLAINLKTEMGKKVVHELVAKSDVFMTNLRQQPIQELQVDYDTLVKYNPKLVYISTSGYGMKGPEANVATHDLTAVAKSGIMMQSGEEGMPPVLPTQGMSDQIGAIAAAYTALAGLMARDRKGIGQHINLSHLGTMMSIQSDCIWLWQTGRKYSRQTRLDTPNPLYNFYRCKDDQWIAIASVQEKFWPRFCQALGLLSIEKDPRFETMPKRSAEGRLPLIKILDDVFATENSDTWIERLKKADVPFSKVNNIEDLLTDPQVLANNYLPRYDHPILGSIGVPGLGVGIDYSETPARLENWAPAIGQHTEEVLSEILGYSWDAIGAMKDAGVI